MYRSVCVDTKYMYMYSGRYTRNSMSIQVKKWTLVKPWDGIPTLDNFAIKEEPLDPSTIKPGEFLCEAMFYSVDPYMRIEPLYEAMQKGSGSDTMIGTQIARVVSSNHEEYPVGHLVIGELGWRTHTIVTEVKVKHLPDMGTLPASLALGCLGLTGVTGYLAVKDILDPKEGEIFVVSSAAGANGSLVGQVAKILGCKVIGFAGSKEKCDWLKKDLDFDHVFNYKEISVDEALESAAPNGVNCYFDNVGGDFTASMIRHMASFGRIAVVGSISTYVNGNNQPSGPYPFYDMILKRIKIQGYVGWDHIERWPEVIQTLQAWIREGKIKYREHISEGFENIPKALVELFTGKTIGKAIVKA